MKPNPDPRQKNAESNPLIRELRRALLYTCMEPALGSREFFLRKAIGWALRQYARVDPHEVIRYVTEKRNELSGLSKREALKHPLRTGLIDALP
jgi:3-methyladenine DNA glycosylase AlkD